MANDPGDVIRMAAGTGEPLLGSEIGDSFLQRAGVQGKLAGGAGDGGRSEYV
jgi:hypothetical protein